MEIIRAENHPGGPGPTDWFTGSVQIEMLFNAFDKERVQGANVSFEPGTRTAWHTHPLGQTLIVTDGVGWTQVEGEERVEFYEGDIMLCPKDKPHWHGATPDSSMTHIAIQEIQDGTPVHWMHHVTDEEYYGTGSDD
mgnify:CR=1 FL=1